MILIDAHVHIYDCFDLKKFFDAAYANFKSEADRLGYGDDFAAILLLAETSKENWFNRLGDYADGKDLPDNKKTGKWTFHRTGESCSLLARSKDDKVLFLVSGRQIVSAENLELLALCTIKSFEDGTPIIELIELIKEVEGIPVIPWGLGKWFGMRGNILSEYLKTLKDSKVFLGDNSGRPTFLPLPSHFQLAKKKGIHILPGSDPLPFATEYNNVGSFGFIIPGIISEDHPAKELKQTLMKPTLSIKSYGDFENSFRFFRNQIKMQLKKRLSN